MNSTDIVLPVLKDLEKIQVSIRALGESYTKTFDMLSTGLLPAVKSMEGVRSGYLNSIYPTVKALNKYSKYLGSSMLDVSRQNKRFLEQLSPALEMVNKHQELIKSLDTTNLSKITSSLGSAFAEAKIRNIDFSGYEQIEPSGGSTETKITLADTISVTDTISVDNTVSVDTDEISKKKLVDMTEDDLIRIVKKSVGPVGTFSVGAFLLNLYSEYVNDAVKVIFEVVFALMITTVTGQYNTEVKIEIINTVQETKAVTDLRKVITKYVKMNPTDQVAFLRKESFLRSGASRKAPIEIKEKITSKTVLTILERKNNWLKVEIDSGDFAGEIGWVEESKVTKFKKIK